MKYTPDAEGNFAGQMGYGYRSIEAFISAAGSIRGGGATVENFTGRLATIQETTPVTAVLEAGRRSLDSGGSVVLIEYDDNGGVAGLC